MNKLIFALAFIAPWSFAEAAVPSESDFLRSCYAVCEQFQADPNHLDGVAEMNLSGEGLSLYRKGVELNRRLRQIGRYDEALVREILITRARAWVFGNGAAFPAKGLTALQTAAIQQYTGEEYKVINPALRSKGPIAEEVLVYRDFINDALARLPAYEGPVVRGIREFKGWDQVYVENEPVTEHSFMSTSFDFGDYKFASDICILVHSRSGRDISRISRSGKEKEVLYPAGTRFFVKKVDRHWNGPRGRILIELEERP